MNPATARPHSSVPAFRAAAWAAVLVGPLAMPRVASGDARSSAEQSAPPAKAGDEVVVVTGTRTAASLQKALVRTDVVSRDDTERRGANDVASALATQTGVQIAPAEGTGGRATSIQIQGFDGERVLVMEDGERVVGDVGGAVDLSAIPTMDISRIEVVAGPTSSLYGSSALGGVVNVITAPPGPQGPSGRFRTEARNPWGFVGQGSAAYRSDDTWAQADANFTRNVGLPKSPGAVETAFPHVARQAIGLRAGTRLGRVSDLSIRVRWLGDDLEGADSQTVPGLGKYVFELPDVTHRVALRAIDDLTLPGGSRLRLSLSRQWFDNRSDKNRPGSPIGESRGRKYAMQSGEGTWSLEEGARTWVGGLRLEVEDMAQTLTRVEDLGGVPVRSVTDEVAPMRMGNGAAYAQVAWKLGPVTFVPSARASAYTRYGLALAPRLAVAWQASRKVLLRANGGRGFRVPSAKEMGFSFDHSFYGYQVAGNPSLGPEASWGANVDATYSPTKALTLKASAFSNWVRDLITLDPNAGVVEGTVTVYRYENVGRARTAGGQVEASLKTAHARFDASYSYLFARDDAKHRPLSARPPHTVVASAEVPLPAGFLAYLRGRVVTSAYVSETDHSPAFATIDARVSHALWASSQAYAGVLDAIGARQDPGRIGDGRPPLGRVFYIGLRADLATENN